MTTKDNQNSFQTHLQYDIMLAHSNLHVIEDEFVKYYTNTNSKYSDVHFEQKTSTKHSVGSI